MSDASENEQYDRIFTILKFDRDKLIEWLDEYFGMNGRDGSYAYWLTRTKEAFNVGTVTLDDFQEFDGDVMVDLANHLIKKLKDPNA